jgi:hypothetical protein
MFAVCVFKIIFRSNYFFCFVLAKPKVDGKVNDVTVQINESAELRTKITATPKPTITWFVHFLSIDLIFCFCLGIKLMI